MLSPPPSSSPLRPVSTRQERLAAAPALGLARPLPPIGHSCPLCSKEHLGSSSQPQRHQANGAPLCHRARSARQLAAIHCLGHRGLPPLGIAPLVLAAPSQCHQLSPLPALCTTVSEHRPVQCTGPDRRGGGRSLSRRRPESLAAAPRGRRVQPAPAPGSGATIHHRALPRKESFLPFVVL